MNYDRAIRALTLQHHLHVGGTPIVTEYDDGSHRRPHPQYAEAARVGLAQRLLRPRRRR